RQHPHFDHHVREMRLNRRRLALLVVLLATVIVAGVVQEARPREQTARQWVSGRAYNMTTGSGLAGVRVRLCGDGSEVVTNGAGYWSATTTPGEPACLDYVSGAPAGLSMYGGSQRGGGNYDIAFV